MSEHGIEELQRQYDAASSKANQANQAAADAKKRLLEGKMAATGLLGHVVSYTRGAEERRFVVESFSRWSDLILAGRKIKKDGTLSQHRDDAGINRLIDHGIYVEPSK